MAGTARRSADYIRLCYGFSLARGVELALLSGESIFPTTDARLPNDVFNLSFIAMLAVAFGICALVIRRGGRPLPAWVFTKAAPVLMTCGIILFASRLTLGDGYRCLSGVLCGTGSALLFVAWQEYFAASKETCATRVMGRSFVGIPVVAAVILALGYPLGTLAAVLALWASAFMLERGRQTPPRSQPPATTSHSPQRLATGIRGPLTTLLIFAAVFGIGGQISFNSAPSFFATNAVSIASVLVAGLIFFAFGTMVGGKISTNEIFNLVVPVVITAVTILPFMVAEYGIVLNGVIVVTYYLVNYNFLCFVARLCQTHGHNASYITCVTQALVRLVMLVGIVGGQLFLANEQMSDFAKICALTLSVVYLISMGLMRNVLARRKDGYAAEPPKDAPTVGGTADSEANAIRPCPIDDMCHLYSLTDRETDIAFLLIEGYSVKLTAEELGVSPNTVRTHIRSIYEKMDVHSRDDLIKFYWSFAKIEERTARARE